MKTVKLSKNSFFTFLYTFLYRRDLPQGLCSFFWANLFALVVFIPIFIWTLPLVIITLFNRNKGDRFIDDWKSEYRDEFGQLMGVSFILWVGVAVVLLYIAGLYLGIAEGMWWEKVNGIFWFVNAIAVICGAVWLWKNVLADWISDIRNNSKNSRAIKWYNNEFDGDRLNDPSDATILRMYKNREKPDSWIDVTFDAIISFYERSCPKIEWK